MNQETTSVIDLIDKFWVQISFLVGAIAAIGEARFRVKDHTRRIEKLESRDQAIDEKLDRILFFLAERK